MTSFKSADGRENLFVSSLAKTDGSKAIRGGIPLVFPIFGPSTSPSTMPQHGFARVNTWELVSTTQEDTAATATYRLELQNVVAGRGEHNMWSIEQAKKDGTDCQLTYVVRLEAQKLTTTLTAVNTGQTTFPVETLLHTYYAIQTPHDADKTFVEGLGDYSIVDKVSKKSGHLQPTNEKVVLDGETDRDFHPAANQTVAKVVLTDSGTAIQIEASGYKQEKTEVPVSCVVWNPGKDKAASMGDMDDDAYEHMICVEPGILADNAVTLEPGQQVSLSQVITVEQ